MIGEIVVQKFGGAALANVETMRRAAEVVAEAHAAGRQLCVVVSAMGQAADDLFDLARQCGDELSPRELDALLACGESMSAPLFALCLQRAGVRAVSLTGAQAGIRTNSAHGSATITGVEPARILPLLAERLVPVIAGSQGASPHGDTTTLGREGADLTAVALGAALGARVVELYADEAGIQHKALEYAKHHQVALSVVPFLRSESTSEQDPTLAPPRTARLPESTGVFEARESNVRGYCRTFPTVFAKAKGALQWDEAGKRYIDFFSGAGALNYGHNPEPIKRRLVEYLERDGVSHALDMYTQAKREFLETFEDVILAPRALDYKVQFCGPTGANSVEAALKLARLATGRTNVASFTGGWHGMTAACLSVCGNRENRDAAGAPLPFTTVLPYPEGPYKLDDALGYVEWLFEDPNSGLDKPAAIILETLQSEGGIYLASPEWLRGIRALCDRHGVLLIADDIQVGCGRTGTFFSFERAGVVPDIVCLSKSIGGYGQPMALLLMRPDLDVWKPGQHTGTFRGNQLAFVAAAAALENWRDPAFGEGIATRGQVVKNWLFERIGSLAPEIEIRGLGLMWGIDVARAGGPDLAKEISAKCFQKGLIIERCGRDDTVLKLMPPLNIDMDHLSEGLEMLRAAAADAFGQRAASSVAEGRGLT